MDISKVLWVDLRLIEEQESCYHYLNRDWAVSLLNSADRLDSEIRNTRPALLCFEFDFPDTMGLAALRHVSSSFPSIPIIMVTEQHSEALAIWALKVHIWDYFIKPLEVKEFKKSIATIQTLKTKETNKAIPRQHNLFSNPIPTELRIRPQPNKKTRPAQIFVEDHYHKKIYEEEVAELCDMNTSTFSRYFKKEYGMTFRNYLINLRIDKATELLRNPNTSVSDIAYTVGFHDPSYFTRMFRRIVGKSPSHYREVNTMN